MLGCAPHPVPPPRDCIQAHNCPKVPIPEALETPVVTYHTVEATDPSTLGCPAHCIRQEPTAHNGPVAGTAAEFVASGDSSAADLDTLLQAITGIGQPDTPGNDNAADTATGNGNSVGGGGGKPPSGAPAGCDPNGEVFSEIASGQVPYGSTFMSKMIQAIRLSKGDRIGTYAIACLEDGTLVLGRYQSKGNIHAERDVIQQAGWRRITDMYSEREPCQEQCLKATRGFNTSWSFRWNPSKMREDYSKVFEKATDQLFGTQ